MRFAITGGADAARFVINAVTGGLGFEAAPDFEAPLDVGEDNVYNIVITVTDGDDLTATQSVTVGVTDVNEAPVAASISAAGDEDTVISGALRATDTDCDVLNFSVVSGPSNGSVMVGANGSFQFTPVADFNGTDSFTFRASDGVLSATATATITVSPVDEPVDPVDPVDPPAATGSTSGDDILFGTALNDTINALAGNDQVNGLAGDDLLIGGGGNDSLKGVGGDDNLKGNGGADLALGNGGADEVFGGGGADTIRGNGGADNLRGNGGADDINGGGGADRLVGAGGNDALRGDGGNDTFIGGSGRDVFQFRTNDRIEMIQDFRQGQDRVEIVSGANSFEALNVRQDGADVLISFGQTEIRVVTDIAGGFDENDSIF